MNRATQASFNLGAAFQYIKDGMTLLPSARGGLLLPVDFITAEGAEGAGVVHLVYQETFDINPDMGTFFDLHDLVDTFNDTTFWANIKLAVLIHNPESLATGKIEVDGDSGEATAGAIPGLRSSELKAGQIGVLLLDPFGEGMSIDATGGGSSITVWNRDHAQVATATLMLFGEG
jgi:hypothetical protein